MTPGIRPLIAGNWKMNGTAASLSELRQIGDGFATASAGKCDGLVCVPSTLISRAATVLENAEVALGGQDCHSSESGAHTGDISAAMLRDAGATHVIVGHSERRTDHRETDADVMAKAGAAWSAGLTAIICIGETEAERDSGETLAVLSRQIEGSVAATTDAANSVIAYEPVWAIGTGKTPTVADVAAAHDHIRSELSRRLNGEAASRLAILYGGSVKPGNAAELIAIPNVDGALIGGASLKAVDFLGIAAACATL